MVSITNDRKLLLNTLSIPIAWHVTRLLGAVTFNDEISKLSAKVLKIGYGCNSVLLENLTERKSCPERSSVSSRSATRFVRLDRSTFRKVRLKQAAGMVSTFSCKSSQACSKKQSHFCTRTTLSALCISPLRWHTMACFMSPTILWQVTNYVSPQLYLPDSQLQL